MARTREVKRYIISIRKGDNVRIISGRDAGKNGRVLSVNPRKNTVIVEHANIIKRHTRPNPAKNIKGGIVEREAAINVSNVQVVCASCGKTRASASRFCRMAARYAPASAAATRSRSKVSEGQRE